jgi:hypothetical protein
MPVSQSRNNIKLSFKDKRNQIDDSIRYWLKFHCSKHNSILYLKYIKTKNPTIILLIRVCRLRRSGNVNDYCEFSVISILLNIHFFFDFTENEKSFI